MLAHAERPDMGLEAARRLGLLKQLHPWLNELYGVKESTQWHEGERDAFDHTQRTAMMAHLRRDLSERDSLELQYAAIAHDLGKPGTNHYDAHAWGGKGDIVSRGHDVAGETMAREFMESVGAPEMAEGVGALVRWHMWPELNDPAVVSDTKLSTLIAKLELAGTSFEQLIRLSEADILGRAKVAPEGWIRGAEWLERAQHLRRERQEGHETPRAS